MAVEPVPTNTATWTKFLAKLKEHGVTVARTASGKPFLLREFKGQQLSWALPSGFDEGDPDKLGFVGGYIVDVVCRQLQLVKTKDFEGWYTIL